MTDKLLFRSGGVTVEIDDIGADLIRRVLDEVAPMLMERIREETEGVYQYAVENWPVGSRKSPEIYQHPERKGKPHSRDQFRRETVLEVSYGEWKVTGRIWNNADYWRFIKPLSLRRGSAIVVWVRKPLEAARDRLRDEMPYLLPEGLRRG